MSREQSIDTLNAFLRDEMDAVETYRHALWCLASGDNLARLAACLASHERRVESLRGWIEALGGRPVADAALWESFARLFHSGGGALGDEAAIAALEEGEDHGLKLYLDDVCKLDRETRRQIERDVLPEQIRTHDSLSDLKLALGTP
jgi:hypothetical protein